MEGVSLFYENNFKNNFFAFPKKSLQEYYKCYYSQFIYKIYILWEYMNLIMLMKTEFIYNMYKFRSPKIRCNIAQQ